MNHFYSQICKNKRYYNTVPFHKIDKSRHFIPANKEWKNSVYSYEASDTKNIPSINDNLYRLFKSYFSSTLLNKKDKRSIRIRNSFKRASTKKVYVSRPEIKETTNKAIINLYIFDRESQLKKSKMYVFDKMMNKNNSIFSISSNLKKKLAFLKSITKKSFIKRLKVRSITLRKRRLNFKRLMQQYRLNYNIFPKLIVPSMLRKHIILKDFFLFAFLKWSLYNNFRIRVGIQKLCNRCKPNKKVTIFNVNGFCSICGNNIYKGGSNKLLLTKNNKKLISLNNFKLSNINKVNLLLSKYFNILIDKTVDNNDKKVNKINKMFKSFQNLRYKHLIKKVLRKELNLLREFAKFQLNKFKFINLTPLKNFISKLYTKKVEFNLVNLKYLHLNSDIYLESIAIKLRKKVSFMKLMKKSLFLAKRPSEFSAKLENISHSITHNPLYYLSNTFTDMFVNETQAKTFSKAIYENHSHNTIQSIVNSLKFKWVSGVRLESRGRITKRYTASRSIYKYVTRGNLRNLEYLHDNEFKNNISVHMTRNQFKPNLQYTKVYSNKRVGTFGIKGWINSV